MKTSTETRDFRKRPLCFEAAVALSIATLALALSVLGVFSPMGALRFPVKSIRTGPDAILLYGATFILPMLFGTVAALLGGHSFRRIERSPVQLSGDGFAFFSIMIGMFAAIIGACTTFAGLIWPIM